MAVRKPVESSLYPRLARWLKSRFGCFKVETNVGKSLGRIDIAGLRDAGGDLSGLVEMIGIEVKNGSQPFLKTCGQARGYAVYAHRVYVADYRSDGFSLDEQDVASALGVGLIQIRQQGCTEVLSSPRYQPLDGHYLPLVERMGYGFCVFCQCCFATGNTGRRGFNQTRLTRKSILKALENDRGMMFWNHEAGERKLGARSGGTHERRYLCPDCVCAIAGK